MLDRSLKAAAVNAGVHLYLVAAEVNINPHRLSRIVNGRDPVDPATAERIREAISRLAERQVEPAR